MVEGKRKTATIQITIGLLLRLAVLVCVITYSNINGRGFMGNTFVVDDIRYETGAQIYANSARKLIDLGAFQYAYAGVGDYFQDVGIQGLFNNTLLWYWICALLVYIFKNTIVIRFANIVFACTTIYVASELFSELGSSKTSTRVAWLLAISPYPVFFSCFCYKDQLLMLLVFSLLLVAVRSKNNGITILAILESALIVSCLFALRSGMSLIVTLCTLLVFFGSDAVEVSKRFVRFLINSPLSIPFFLALSVLIFNTYDDVLYKLEYYFINASRFTSSSTMAGLFTINGINELYKLPFSYLYSLFVPLALYIDYRNWYGVVGQLNFLFIPVSVGTALYFFVRKKRNPVFYWSMLALYLASLISGVGVFRHYYSLIPFNYYCYSELMNSKQSNPYIVPIVVLCSIATAMVFVIYFCS